MMERLITRGEELARDVQQRRVQQVAQQLGEFFDAVEAQESQVLVSGRGVLRRWLADPGLRFLARGQQ